MLQTIKVSAVLTGGPNKVAEVIGTAIAMALPQSMQVEFLNEVSQDGDELRALKLSEQLGKALPSASLVRRYEIALDLCIMKLTQIRRLREPTIKLSTPLARNMDMAHVLRSS